MKGYTEIPDNEMNRSHIDWKPTESSNGRSLGILQATILFLGILSPWLRYTSAISEIAFKNADKRSLIFQYNFRLNGLKPMRKIDHREIR